MNYNNKNYDMNYMNQTIGSNYCNGIIYKIQSGDSLYSISRRYNVPLGMLLKANPYVDVYNLQIGTNLCIPIDVTSLEPFPMQTPMPQQEPMPVPMMPREEPMPTPMMPREEPMPAPMMPREEPMPAPMMPREEPMRVPMMPREEPMRVPMMPREEPMPMPMEEPIMPQDSGSNEAMIPTYRQYVNVPSDRWPFIPMLQNDQSGMPSDGWMNDENQMKTPEPSDSNQQTNNLVAYVVKRNESLSDILEKFGIELEDLAQLNNLNEIILYPGTTIMVPNTNITD